MACSVKYAMNRNQKKHANIPVFIPHLGCPNDCVFCNQKTISGVKQFDISSVDGIISTALSTIDTERYETEIAFFGGSFTGIEPALMHTLLKIAQRYIDSGQVRSIRLSTRPDYIHEEILDQLKQYDVKHIELGIQSLDNRVLNASQRGHSAEQSFLACRLVKKYGFSLTGQMMLGLPCSSLEAELETAQKLCAWGVDSARIYPTVVFKNTPLAQAMAQGAYLPLSESEAIGRSAAVLEVFEAHQVQVLRIGLCAQEALLDGDEVLSGNYHSALGEYAQSELFYRKITQNLLKRPDLRDKNKLLISCAPGQISKVIGHKRINAQRLRQAYQINELKIVEKNTLVGYNILID